MKNKRKDRNIKPLNFEREETAYDELPITIGGINKSLLILVEGETEQAYFDGLKSNIWIKEKLAGIKIRLMGSLDQMILEAVKERDQFEHIWFVYDNDKRNAFVIDRLFFEKIETKLPKNINKSLLQAFNEDLHSYFFSIYDFLQWLSTAMSHSDIVMYWDTIQHSAIKNEDFKKFQSMNPYLLIQKSDIFYDKVKAEYTNIYIQKAKKFNAHWKKFTTIAYSCISFEFWLLIHFEQNKTPFLWVNRDKDEAIDVVTYFKNHYCSEYSKGLNVKPDESNAYTCLKDDFKKKNLTFKEEQKVLFKVINAYRNSIWLKNEMADVLKRQNNKWYEVNPYIEGLDLLISNLLDLKKLDESIKYYDWDLIFSFDKGACMLAIVVNNNSNSSIVINNSHQSCFELVNDELTAYKPININVVNIVQSGTVLVEYDIPLENRDNLILQFKDPLGGTKKNKSASLLVLLD